MKETTLTSHRAKKSMVDFLRTIVVDSLSLPVNNRTVPIIDIIVDACPDSSNYSQQCQFQTELLSTVMEYLISADVILGEQGLIISYSYHITLNKSNMKLTLNYDYFAGPVQVYCLSSLEVAYPMWPPTFSIWPDAW